MKKRRIVTALLLALLTCCLAFALVACGGKHTVTFDFAYDGDGDGENDKTTVKVDDGALITAPTEGVPVREGYTITAWETEEGEVWDFAADTVTGDLTLTAQWSQGEPIVTPEPSGKVTIEFEAGEAENAQLPDRMQVDAGKAVTLPAATAEGYRFVGWRVAGAAENLPAGQYTPTASVKLIAQWQALTVIDAADVAWETDGVLNVENESPAVAKDLVGTFTPSAEQGGGDAITVTITRDVLQAALEAALESEDAIGTDYTAGALYLDDKPATCTVSGYTKTCYGVYYEVAETDFVVIGGVVLYNVPEQATGHDYEWDIAAGIADKLLTSASSEAERTITGACANGCGETKRVVLPLIVLSGGQTNIFAAESDMGFTQKSKDALTQGQYFVTAYTPYGCVQAGFISGEYLAEVSGEEKLWIAFNDLEISAVGHSFDETVTATEQEGVFTLTATCNHAQTLDCPEEYTATVTFDAGDGSGSVASWSATFNAAQHTFTFKLPASGFTSSSGDTFIGFIVKDGDGTNLNPGQPITLNADDSVTYVAQYEAHEHSYGTWEITNPSANAAGTAKRTCPNCGDKTAGKTQTVTLPELAQGNIGDGEGKYTKSGTGATCTQNGSIKYVYTTSASDDCGAGVQITFTVNETATGHSWSAVSWRENAASATCENGCDTTLTATVTFNSGAAEGSAPVLMNESFKVENNKLVLTLPENSYTAPEKMEFDHWLIDGSVYAPNETVEIDGEVTITAEWKILAIIGTDSNVALGTWGGAGAVFPNYTLYEGQSITITAKYSALTNAKDWAGVVVQIEQAPTGTDSWFFRPDRYASYLKAWGTQTNMTVSGDALPGEFNALRVAGKNVITISLANDTITVKEDFYNESGEQIVYTFTWTVTGATAEQYSVNLGNDQALAGQDGAVTLENVTVTAGILPSENQNPTSEDPIKFGNSKEFAYTGFKPVWVGMPISAGEKVTMTGALKSAGNNYFEALIVNLFGAGRNTLFRMDDWIANPELAGWTGTKISEVTESERTTFCNIIKDCALTVEIDWTTESAITISATYVSTGSAGSKTVEFKITPMENRAFESAYMIGLGCEDCEVTINSIVRAPSAT